MNNITGIFDSYKKNALLYNYSKIDNVIGSDFCFKRKLKFCFKGILPPLILLGKNKSYQSFVKKFFIL